MVEKQMEEVMQQDLATEDNEAKKKEIFKSLKKYEVSKEFKKVQEFCDEAMESLLDDLYAELESRETVSLQFSQVTERQMYKGVLEKCAEHITNEHYKAFLLERAWAHKTYIENFIGGDEPIFSALDIIKHQRQEYYNVKNNFLSFCISKYSTEKDGEGNPHQPYED